MKIPHKCTTCGKENEELHETMIKGCTHFICNECSQKIIEIKQNAWFSLEKQGKEDEI